MSLLNRTSAKAEALASCLGQVVVLDCRFALGDSGAGARAYADGHIPGAHYIHLERDLSGPVGEHGGRHPLPEPSVFAERLALLGENYQKVPKVFIAARKRCSASAAKTSTAVRHRPTSSPSLNQKPPRFAGGGIR